VLVFDEHFLPDVFGVVDLVEALDGDVLVDPAVPAQDILEVQVPTDLAMIAALFHTVAGQGHRIRDVGFALFDEPRVEQADRKGPGCEREVVSACNNAAR